MGFQSLSEVSKAPTWGLWRELPCTGVLQCKVSELEWKEEGIYILGTALHGDVRARAVEEGPHSTVAIVQDPNEARKASVLRKG